MNPNAIAALLLVLAWKSTVVLAIATAATWSLRRASAAVRHSLWTVAVAALLAIPVLELSAPRLTAHVPAGLTTSTVMPIAMRPLNGSPTLPVADVATETATPVVETPETVQPENKKWSEPTGKAVLPGEASESSSLPSEPTLADPHSGPTLTETATPWEPAAPAAPPSWPLLAIGIWIGGAIAVTGFFLSGRVMLMRITRRSQEVQDADWLALLEETRERLGIRRRVRLLIGDDVVTPVTWGTFRPRILLPACASHWSREFRVAMLTHELAHVRRFDCAIQDAAHLVCAFYWWHPGVWFVAHQLRKERESACDDVVLRAGAGAADYAGQLVDVVRAARRPGAVLAMSGAAMAQRSDLERRVRAILDEATDRRSVSFGRVLAAAAIAAVFVLPLGALEFTASAREDRTNDSVVWSGDEPSALKAMESDLKKAAEALQEPWSLDGLKSLSVPMAELAAPIEAVSPEELAAIDESLAAAASDLNRATYSAEPMLAADVAVEPVTVEGKTLGERWEKALADNRKSGSFWVAYSIEFDGGKEGREILMMDSGDFDWDELRSETKGPSLVERFGIPANDAVLLFHYPGHGKDFDRVSVRTATLKPNLDDDAVLWLGRIPHAESFAALAPKFRKMSDNTRASAVLDAISLHQNPEVEPLLEQVLFSKRSEEIRSNAAEGLARHPGKEALGALEGAAYKDEKIEVRAEAAESIGDMPYAPATPVLIKLAHKAEPERVRMEAVESLAEREPDKVLKELEAIALSDPSETVQMEATETLGDLPGEAGWPALRRLAANHPSKNVRDEAFETLGEKARGPESDDEVKDTKKHSKDSKMGLEEPKGAEKSALKRLKTTDDVEALGEEEGFESVSLLRSVALQHPDPELRTEALQILSDKAPQQALLVLHRVAMKDPDENVRVEAIETMGELEDAAGISMLEDLANNGPDEATRAEAFETLSDKAPDRALVLVDRWAKEKKTAKPKS
jgi:beta-lactamase regulating signal transducer with metallopeptidase domain/HEAT repeat protein